MGFYELRHNEVKVDIWEKWVGKFFLYYKAVKQNCSIQNKKEKESISLIVKSST